MSFQQNSIINEILSLSPLPSSSYDQDKYELALDAVIRQMNLLSNDPSNENLRLAHEQARQRFIQISNMEKDEYDKFIHSKVSSTKSQDQINRLSHDRIQHIEQLWFQNLYQIYMCYFICIFFFLTISLICLTIALK